MADTPTPDAIVKKEPEQPERDPIVSRSTSAAMLISALLLIGVLAWALYDEAYGQRPWKRAQQEFVQRYTRYLNSIKRQAGQTQAEVMKSADYQLIEEELKAAKELSEPKKEENKRQIKIIEEKLAAITDPFQNVRGQITVVNYRIETAPDAKKADLRQQVEKMKQEQVNVDMPADDGSGKTTRQKLNYTQLAELYEKLKDQKAQLLVANAELSKETTELEKKKAEYLKDHMTGLTPAQISSLITKNENFDYSLKQINVSAANIVDRCETCHLGMREPLTLKASDLAPDGPGKKPDEWARAFVSHPSKELLTIHNPDRFGCSGCHGGNGRATTSVEKGHGRHRFWLHPLHEKENMEAGCQQCHTADRVLDGAPTLTLGKDLFQNRGCVGCHRSEGFDRESDALANTRQQILQLEENVKINQREAQQAKEAIPSASEAEAPKLQARVESLTVINSIIAAQIDQLNIQARYLMQDQKKVGPNLKDVRLKLVKEWIPEWLRDPQGFRPGTKMPTFWRLNAQAAHDPRADDDRKAIAAYLWQESFDGSMPPQDIAKGNVENGRALFETTGCMACHSIGEEDSRVGGDFAANLQRVGEKSKFEFIVRWIYNPRQRWAPYCPKHKREDGGVGRDLTPADYPDGKMVFDTEQHSKCPVDGAELQVQNMTVMPNFRLSQDEARDIATYLFSLSGKGSYPDASYMEDANLKDRGRYLIKQYGCAGCHEIKGFEEEQRIGKELTAEGSTPIERLDFALLTQKAEKGIDPETNKEGKEWYNHKGFFEHKLKTPWIYDQGKEKEPQDRLRMPQPYLTPQWKTALTTFLMGSVGAEGANVPSSLFYRPEDRRKAVQDGWWLIKKYNCMGCHSIQVGQRSVLMDLPYYQNPDNAEKLPPKLNSEGARVNPNWLLKFLHDPSLSEGKAEPGANNSAGATPSGNATANQKPQQAQAPQAKPGATPASAQPATQGDGGTSAAAAPPQNQAALQFMPQPGANRNGVRTYLKARMPTFNFSPNELQMLVRFFMAVSSQQEPYIPEPIEPLTEQEVALARMLFTSNESPCLKCHITGDPKHDETATAPNFLLTGERLKPQWTYRWVLDPQKISPGVVMPSGLFKRENNRMVLNSEQLPAAFNAYGRDHAELLVRYMFLLTPEEQRRLTVGSPPATSGSTPAAAPAAKPQGSTSHAPRRPPRLGLKSHGIRKALPARARAPVRRASFVRRS
ncbi:MAG TPA: c-type cytochrome [Pyrinomonadaceae bacterium]